ncbi:isochorismate synthase [Flavobacterium sp. RHBU_3]|uniref:isochorismate synthase n=1 Tax=Flavobacterium sp. RHBU_3 TaxID=3391184 RepID=UPI003984A7DE
MEDIFIRLKQQLAEGKPFALYAKPGEAVVNALFQKTDIPHTLNGLNGQGFVFAPFYNDETAFIPLNEAEVFTATISNNNATTVQSDEPVINPEAKTAFENLVTLCVNEIKTGKFHKLVASRTEFVETDKEIAAIYTALLHTYPTAYRYCFYHPVSGLWMGATPEQLLKAANNTINTVALAGTQLFDANNEAVWENKEREEQQFVTDYILSQLAPFTETITATAPYTHRAGGLVHIKTDISATLKHGNALADIITTLHPTPAVCGLPKEAARDFLVDNEGYNREYYSGFLGELDMNGSTNLFVNLRSMKMHQGKAQLFIGCGITKDSDPEKEFYETVNKSKTMRKAL